MPTTTLDKCFKFDMIHFSVYEGIAEKFKTKRLIAHHTCCLLLQIFVKINVNYSQRIPVNVGESTVVGL